MDKTFIRLLTDLLNIDGPSRSERKVADFILAYCRKTGANVVEDKSARLTGGNAGNITAWPRGTSLNSAQTLFCSHMDTVDVGPSRSIKITKRGIYAAGGYPVGIDNRLGVAFMLRLLKEKRPEVAFAFTTQEEIGMFGAEKLALPKGIRVIYNLDGSQAPGHFVLSTVGCVTFRFKITGLAAHAGINPNGGKNAVEMAARAVARLRLGMPGSNESINIGVLRGGSRSNVVAQEAEVIGEVRANSLQKTERVLAGITSVFRHEVRRLGGTLECFRDDMFKPYAHKRQAPHVRRVIKAIADAGITPVFGHYRGGSDANVFNFRGVPSVNVSIGARNPHSPSEHAEFMEMEQAWAIVSNLAGSFSCAGEGI